MSDDTERGIYRKYKITRTDRSHRKGRKHEDCTYFVLDLQHDAYALDALGAYADACEGQYPQLADDLREIVNTNDPGCGCREAACPHEPLLGRREPFEIAGRLMDDSS